MRAARAAPALRAVRRARGAGLLCNACAADLPRIATACPACALPPPGGVSAAPASRVRRLVARRVAAFVYAFPVDRLLQAAQIRRTARTRRLGRCVARGARRGVARVAGRAAGSRHRVAACAARQRERGFNQAREIARARRALIALPLGAPLERVAGASPQAALPGGRGRATSAAPLSCATTSAARGSPWSTTS